MCRLTGNMGTSNSWNTQGLSSPVQGLFYLYMTWVTECLNESEINNSITTNFNKLWGETCWFADSNFQCVFLQSVTEIADIRLVYFRTSTFLVVKFEFNKHQIGMSSNFKIMENTDKISIVRGTNIILFCKTAWDCSTYERKDTDIIKVRGVAFFRTNIGTTS